MTSILIALHVVAAVIWVGGMFFAHMALRPAVSQLLEPPIRLPLLRQTLSHFFPWVWVSVITILVTGYGLLISSHGAFSGGYVHVMQMIGFLMAGLFFYVYFVPYKGMIQALDEKDIPVAGAAMGKIRQIIGVNLVLGLVATFVGASKLF